MPVLHRCPSDIGVIVAAVIFIKLTSPKRFYADPAVSLAISMVIFASAIPMSVLHSVFERMHPKFLFPQTALKSGRILLEASPIHLDLAKVKEDLLTVCYFAPYIYAANKAHLPQVPNVVAVHDLHVWHLSQS